MKITFANLSLLGAIYILVIGNNSVHAQVTPDNSLNTSVSGSNHYTITNGTRVGNNLFHSFSQFSIPSNGSASFQNAADIQNIFSRVTGGNASYIDGLISANGSANLFLLNPAGIIFGQNASLNIGGSFVATTANSIKSADGTEFSAVNHSTLPLLTMSVPIGLQMGQNLAPIQVRGKLTAGQDLSLEAGSLDLQGELVAGRDLTLKAQDTVQIRDTATTPFLAQAGRNLTIQGNQGIDILALSHPVAALQSGGNLSLISNGNISGDAHFISGGNLSFQTLAGTPGKFVSLFDPIIYANGDVVFGDYTGVALKVEATGSIEGGNIVITGPDVSVPISDPDYITLTTQPAAILRAGVASVPTANLPQLGFTAGTVADLPLGSIRVSSINTSNTTGGDGGSITLNAAGDIFTGNLNSSSKFHVGDSGNGGDIKLFANGNISINGLVDSNSMNGSEDSNWISSGNSKDGGAIAFSTTNGDISFNGILSSLTQSLSGTSGNAGAIAFSTTNGDISFNGDLVSLIYSNYGTSANTGAITFSTTNGDISFNGNLFSLIYSIYGTIKNGGAITFSTTNGNLLIKGALFSDSQSLQQTSGNSSNITLTATNGNILIDGIVNSSSESNSNSGNGGDINLTATNGNLITQGELISFSYSTGKNSGNSGDINLTATDGILSNNSKLHSISYSTVGNSSNSGDINLAAKNGDILGNGSSLYTFSLASQGTAKNAGSVFLDAQNQISGMTVLTTSSSAEAGNVSIIGRGDLAIADFAILTSKQVTVDIPFRGLLTIQTDGTGRSGDVSITSGGNLTLTNSRIESDTKGSDSAGNVTLTSPGLMTFNQSQILSSTSSTGQAGIVNIITDRLTFLNGSSINSSTSASGNAGGIKLNVANTLELDNSTISASTSGSGKGGEIALNTDTLQLFNQSIISSNTTGIGNAGAIDVTAKAIALNQSTISSQSLGQGNSGTVKLNTGTLDLVDNAIVSTASSQSGKAGNLSIIARDRINLQTGSQMTSRSTGTGNGGTVEITGRALILNQNAQINASTVASDGGNLVLNLSEFLRLSDRSIVNAEAGDQGNGGNISINSPFIIGSGNSDIIANAVRGRGGNINITTNSILGLDFRTQLTPGNDITASSEFGVNGSVQISTPEINPNSGLVELPANGTDQSQQIASGCAANQSSSFVATGRGGIPQNPTQFLSSERPWSDIRNISAYRNTGAVTAQIPESAEVIVQATGWRRNAQGKIELFADTSPTQMQPSLTCAAVSQN